MTKDDQKIVTEIRRQAEAIRKAASIRTSGNYRADKLLRQVAEKLEQRAAKIEQQEGDK